jgi:glycosyltransferase involved in cell wall biosynthesis
MPPLVSAIVAAHNEQRRIAECLESLLEQTYRPLDITVVDDGSTDATPTIAEQFAGVRLIRRPHEGKARAVNHAAAVVEGKILVLLDADLYFDRHYVEHLTRPLVESDAIGSSHASEFVANPHNTWSRCSQQLARLPPDRRLNLSPEQIAAGTPIYRAILRREFLDVGGFDDAGHVDDQTLWPKLGRRGVFVVEAVCHHYNVETLKEVFAAGVWGGKSNAGRYGGKSVVRALPPFSLWRALVSSIRLRNAAVFPYILCFETGSAWGALRILTGLDTGYGR